MTAFEDPVAGKLVVLTGGDSGLAMVVAEKLVERRARIAMVVREASGAGLAEEVAARGWGDKADVFAIDQDLHESASDVLIRIVSRMGDVDGLVNNAGVRTCGRFQEVTAREWDEVMAINMKGTFFMSQAFVETVRAQAKPAAIVNIASHLGIAAAKDYSLYAISKAGVIAITRSLAIELARENITVNAVAPGPTNTVRAGLLGDELEVMDFLQRMPIARRVETADVADAVIYLLGTAGGSVTGHTLVVDGGWTIW